MSVIVKTMYIGVNAIDYSEIRGRVGSIWEFDSITIDTTQVDEIREFLSEEDLALITAENVDEIRIYVD